MSLESQRGPSSFRSLCAELLAVFNNYDDESNLVGIFDDMKANKIDLLDRARAALAAEAEGEELRFDGGYESGSMWTGHPLRPAALAKPEPATDKEVAGLVAWLHGQDGGIDRRATYSRIADLLSRLAPQPVPEGPSNEELDEELDELAEDFMVINEDGTGFVDDHVKYARAVLARWGQS